MSEDLIERVLEAARWAPSPHGRQPWRFAVLRSEETKERLAGAMGEEWRANLEMDGQSVEIVEKRLEGSRRRLLAGRLYCVDLPLPRRPRCLPRCGAPARRDNDGRPVIGRRSPERATRGLRLGPRRGLDVCPLFCPERVVEALGLDPSLVPHAAHAGIRRR